MNMAAVTEQKTEAFDWKLTGFKREVEFTETSLITIPWYALKFSLRVLVRWRHIALYVEEDTFTSF